MISICVPFWDRQPALDSMVATYAQYADLPLEFSLCDDGSRLPARPPHEWHVTRLPAKAGPLNPCVPINCAVAASHGDIIVLTTPEIFHPQPVLRELLTLIQHEDDYAIACCRDRRKGIWLAGPETSYSDGGRLPVPPGGHFHFLVAFTRSLWQRAKGFDEDYRKGQACDDNDWLWRVYEAGARFRTTTGFVWHTTNRVDWRLTHNTALFYQKWPEARRRQVIALREG